MSDYTDSDAGPGVQLQDTFLHPPEDALVLLLLGLAS